MSKLILPDRPLVLDAAPKPEATSRGSILFSPAVDLPHRFAAASGRSMECAVLRPIDLTRTHAVKVDMEAINVMAADYDPAFEAAALNFDHSWGGPAHGLSPKIWIDGEFLWCRMDQLSEEAVDGIASGKWPRRSSEFWMSHPQTGRPYWCGLALLGSATPAVPGLPSAVLLSTQPQRPIYRLISTGAAVAPSAPTTGETAKEAAMPNPKKKTAATPPGAEVETPETTETETAEVETLAETEAAPALAPSDASAKPATVADLAADRAALAAEREASRKERLAAKQERAEATVEKLFTRLGSRVSPAVQKLAAPLLVALAAQLEPLTLKLSVGGKSEEKGIFEQLVAVLEAMPEHRFVGNQPAAEADPKELAAPTPEASAIAQRAGITPERRAELAARYPGTYGATVN